MRKILVVASAMIAGIILTPQARASHGVVPARHVAGNIGALDADAVARAAARSLRHHGFWGFGKARVKDGRLFLQANRGRGQPVMIKISLASGRILAVKKFRQRHVRTGIALNGMGPLAMASRSKRPFS